MLLPPTASSEAEPAAAQEPEPAKHQCAGASLLLPHPAPPTDRHAGALWFPRQNSAYFTDDFQKSNAESLNQTQLREGVLNPLRCKYARWSCGLLCPSPGHTSDTGWLSLPHAPRRNGWK